MSRSITIAARADPSVLLWGRVYREQKDFWLLDIAKGTSLYRAEKSQWDLISENNQWPTEDGIYVPTVAAHANSPFIFIRDLGEWSICNTHGNFPDRTADSILEEFFDQWDGLTRLGPKYV